MFSFGINRLSVNNWKHHILSLSKKPSSWQIWVIWKIYWRNTTHSVWLIEFREKSFQQEIRGISFNHGMVKIEIITSLNSTLKLISKYLRMELRIYIYIHTYIGLYRLGIYLLPLVLMLFYWIFYHIFFF